MPNQVQLERKWFELRCAVENSGDDVQRAQAEKKLHQLVAEYRLDGESLELQYLGKTPEPAQMSLPEFEREWWKLAAAIRKRGLTDLQRNLAQDALRQFELLHPQFDPSHLRSLNKE